jgi:hypothetical protein
MHIDAIGKIDNMTGMRVGAGRWAYSAAHPDCWLAPYVGTVLSAEDPQAWQGTLAFPGDELPDPAKVKAWAAQCRKEGLLDAKVPVLWDFPTGQTVRWETLSALRLPADDRKAWEEARAAAYSRETSGNKNCMAGVSHGSPIIGTQTGNDQ